MSNKKKIFENIIFVIFLIIVLVIFYNIFEKYNYNDFQKSEYYVKKTEFKRDSKVKYNKNNSYKIYSKDFNDAIFYKTIKVEKNTPYKISCMVKTENIETEKESSISGACISVTDTTEVSRALVGTNDWTKIELLVDSKDREELNIGFRLGGYEENCKGKAWFSDFEIESGTKDLSSEWKFGLFIFEHLNVDVEKNGVIENVQISMNQEDIDDMKDDIERFKESIKKLSGNQMTATVNIYDVKEPITTLSYDNDNGYFVGTKDVKEIIDKIVLENEFDHIFVAVRFGNILKNTEIPVNDWIGLGYMDYYGIGFSNIRLPNSKNSYIYRYNEYSNTFPEEVFTHEFLHSLERNLNERNYTIPELHSYSKYGYKNSAKEGLKQWYSDYMQKKIKTSNEDIGLYSDVYTMKPLKQSNFEYSAKLDYFNEPKTIFGQILSLISTLF